MVSIGFRPGLPLERIAELVDAEGSLGADIIALPETCRGQDHGTRESSGGATVSALAPLAKKHRTYIACPIDRQDGDRRLNSAVLIDRRGEIVCVYDKLYPFQPQEWAIRPPVQPGDSVAVCSADFGRVGLAICYDVNWPHIWRGLSQQGAELVIWPSAYSAGRSLQAHAINYNYYIVSSTWIPDCRVYDIDGEQLLYERDNGADGTNLSRITLDLDRCLFHQDVNFPHKLNALLADHGDDVEQEKWLPMEAWFMLRAKRPGVSARELARQYGLEERRPYLDRTAREIDCVRGNAVSAAAR